MTETKKALTSKQLTQLAKDGAKTPSNQQVQGVKTSGGTVERRGEKVVVTPD